MFNRRITVALIALLNLSGWALVSTNTFAQGVCGKAPILPNSLSGSSLQRPLVKPKQKAITRFLRKTDRYLDCQDSLSPKALSQLSPKEKRERSHTLSELSQVRRSLARRLNRELANQRKHTPF